MYKFVMQDLACNSSLKIKILLLMFRLGTLIKNKKYLLVLFKIIKLFYVIYSEFLLGIELPLETSVGSRLTIYHGVGLVVNPNSVIGNDVILRNGVVIGNRDLHSGLAAKVGDNVEVGCNAIIIGNISVGDRVKIGAGTVVVKSIENDKTVVSANIRYL